MIMKRFAEGGVTGNSMLLRGISGVVLGYSRLDGDAARAQVGKVCSLISQEADLPYLY